MKFFISQPMRYREEDQILEERLRIEKSLNFAFDNVYVLDSFLVGAKEVKPLVCLGHSLTILSKAEAAIFLPDWQTARGCRIEYDCCREYGIPIYFAFPNKAGFYKIVKEEEEE